jgi:hypothetical protein
VFRQSDRRVSLSVMEAVSHHLWSPCGSRPKIPPATSSKCVNHAGEAGFRSLPSLGSLSTRVEPPLPPRSNLPSPPAPAFHAATKAVRKTLWEMYAAFLAAFREAAEKWRAGDRTAKFPVGSFPPGLPFVTAEAAAGSS